ncbi:MAG: membrane protein insertase YidC [Bacteroidales bacterium]|jgi:YidC/Oxa1 family membrane protein insertase
MDRNTIIGIILIAGVLIVSSILTQPSKTELEIARRKQDSIYKVEKKKAEEQKATVMLATKADSAKVKKADTVKANSDTVKTEKAEENSGVFGSAANGKEEFITIENDLLKLEFSNRGGKIYSVQLKKYKTFEGKPLILFENDSLGISFYSNNRSINTDKLYFTPQLKDNHITVSGNDSVTFAMRLFPDSSQTKYIEYVYIIKGNSYDLKFKINFSGMKDVIAENSTFIDLNWSTGLLPQEKSIKNERMSSTVYFKYLSDEVNYLSETKAEQKELKTKIKWIDFKQQFFSSILIADESFESGEVQVSSDDTSNSRLKYLKATLSIPFNSEKKEVASMRFYFGPNHYQTLKKYNLDFERVIPLGWSFFLIAWINKGVIFVFNFLENFNMNYGLIILVLTILLKILLFPIAYKTYISSAKMRILKPEVEEINQKFPKKEDAMKKQQATMALYKKAGANPMSGCVPMLLQFPILIAMYRFFPASIELRQKGFLWADDLSTYDSVLSLPFTIPMYGSHVSLFALLMTISTVIYTKMNSDMMGGASSNQMPGMKTMMYIMPVMFLLALNSFSSALSYYYLLANLITFGQQAIIKKYVDEDKLHKQIQENKAKNVTAKKSKFQLRLEEMAKQRGYRMKK